MASKMYPISDKLSLFLNLENQTKMTIKDVAKLMNSYIRDNGLQGDHANINPDDKLKELLEIEDNTQLTYFNLREHMNKHFIGFDLDEYNKEMEEPNGYFFFTNKAYENAKKEPNGYFKFK